MLVLRESTLTKEPFTFGDDLEGPPSQRKNRTKKMSASDVKLQSHTLMFESYIEQVRANASEYHYWAEI